MAKRFATEAAPENSLEAMRIHGAYGYSREFNIERYYCDVPLLAIGEGTNVLQHIIITSALVKRNLGQEPLAADAPGYTSMKIRSWLV